MKDFWYVYILVSESRAGAFYIGFTTELHNRLAAHNAGQVPHTSKFRPWRIRTATAFDNKTRALAFEKYVKSSSGRAFSRKRF